MEYSKAVRIVEYFLERYALKEIVLLGGEPTIVPYFSKFVEYLRHRFDKKITVITNGIYQVPFDLIPNIYIDNVCVSIDGISENTHDAIRGRGSLQKSLRTLKYLIKRNFNTSIIYTVMGKNISEVIDAILFF
jgi:MoaA/NifB/PqqE/SkfB family radical SAM enzyme